MSVWQTPQPPAGRAPRRPSGRRARPPGRRAACRTPPIPRHASWSWRALMTSMWVIFDLNGTLLDPAGLLDPPELPIAALDEANMMAMITVIAGPRDHVQAAVRGGAAARAGARRARAGRGGRRSSGSGDARLPGRARTRCRRLRDAGLRLAVLTQSAVEPSETALANAGIREHFEHVLSAPGVRRLQARGPRLPRGAGEGRRDRRLVRRRPLVGRRGRAFAGPQDRLDQPHRPRLPGRDARAARARRRHRGGGREDQEGQSLFRFGGIGGARAGGGSSPARARS